MALPALWLYEELRTPWTTNTLSPSVAFKSLLSARFPFSQQSEIRVQGFSKSNWEWVQWRTMAYGRLLSAPVLRLYMSKSWRYPAVTGRAGDETIGVSPYIYYMEIYWPIKIVKPQNMSIMCNFGNSGTVVCWTVLVFAILLLLVNGHRCECEFGKGILLYVITVCYCKGVPPCGNS